MTANHAHTFQSHVVTAVRDNIAKHYGDLYYCTRDESAWSYGTMSLEDFHTIAHDDDVLDGLTESALEVLSGELAAAEQRGADRVIDHIRKEANDAAGHEWAHPDQELQDIADYLEVKYRADRLEGDDE